MLPAEFSHNLSPLLLPVFAKLSPCRDSNWRGKTLCGLKFRNPIGIAGGVDKVGKSLLPWQKLGAGFVEVGTVTPKPQGPNPGNIIARDLSSMALWNKMGFPNEGVDVLTNNLKKFKTKSEVPLFINVGKNRWTSNERAYEDYIECIEKTHRFADAFVINLSSPNTKGLRELQSQKFLQEFLQQVVSAARNVSSEKPIFLKLSPDMEASNLEQTILASFSYVDGWVLTNTTAARRKNSPFPKEGGVSGAPLSSLSLQALVTANRTLGQRRSEKILISVGGIMTSEDIEQRLALGADLVQVYAALVFHGPGFFTQIFKSLKPETLGH